MKSSLERVKVIKMRNKEVTPLDFYTFFHLVDNTTRNQALKQDPRTPTSLHLYSNNTHITTTFILSIEPENAQYLTAAIFELMNKHEYDYYVIVIEGCRCKGEDPKVYKRGDIRNLPIDKKQEILIVDGKSKDAKESLFISYEIIRAQPEDHSSQILRFEQFTDSTKRSWHAEQTIKRKWFSSMQGMIDEELNTRTEDPAHEVYWCELETTRSDKGITKVMCVIEIDYDVLYEAIESLVAEQKNVLRSKSSHDYVLYMLQLKIIRADPERQPLSACSTIQ